MSQTTLVKLSAIRQQLDRCRDLRDLKKIRDQAAALQAYTKAQGLSADLQAQAAGIRIDAEARLGELLREQRPERGRPEKGSPEMQFPRPERQRFRALARIPEPQREALKTRLGANANPSALLKIARGEAKARRAREVLAAGKRGPDVVTGLAELIAAGALFGTVYADPPWAYSNKATRSAVAREYMTMTVDEIAALPVRDVVLDLAHLHLWTTNAFLFEARRVLEAWGFEYKSCFVWVKPKMGIGNYWRVSHEFLLLGTRGGPAFGDEGAFRDKGLMSWAELRAGKHSAKPEAVRAMVQRASPGPYLEMFGRAWVDGDWTVLGNEVGPGQRMLATEEATA